MNRIKRCDRFFCSGWVYEDSDIYGKRAVCDECAREYIDGELIIPVVYYSINTKMKPKGYR